MIFLTVIAVTYTIPWDSYLIRTGIWSYPPNVIAGYTLCDIPLEEIFFFAIQTYNTSLIYLLLGKVIFHPAHIQGSLESGTAKSIGRFGQSALLAIFFLSLQAAKVEGRGTYLALILVWASPVLFFIWTLCYSHILSLRWPNTLLPIAFPTGYLWIVDTLALRRGTWIIEDSTKLGIYLWPGGLYVFFREAVFFFLTNLIIVCGLICTDHYMAVLATFPSLFPSLPPYPSPRLLFDALTTSENEYPKDRLLGMKDAVNRLRGKSRSFWVASSAFDGRLRVDLLMLYSFCRVADDLIDEAPSYPAAVEALRSLRHFLDLAYTPVAKRPEDISSYVRRTFPAEYQSAFFLLPTEYLPREPLDELLEGFGTDLTFSKPRNDYANVEIKTEADLNLYARRVAGTVAELCLHLVFNHCQETDGVPEDIQQQLIAKGIEMGVALQYVNIARDIEVDARMRPGARVYLPRTWLDESAIDVKDLVRSCDYDSLSWSVGSNDSPLSPSKREVEAKIETLRGRLLKLGMSHFHASRPAIEEIPQTWGARRGMRVAVESYIEIGRAIAREMETGKERAE
ncbi:hypothetical protein FRB98_004455, partial [Tulasnella sp. 332]